MVRLQSSNINFDISLGVMLITVFKNYAGANFQGDEFSFITCITGSSEQFFILLRSPFSQLLYQNLPHS